MRAVHQRIKRIILVAGAYLLLALVATYPLVLHFNDYFIGGAEDGSMSIWSIWWMKFSLADLHQGIFDCQYLFYPFGANLTFHSIPKVLGAIGIPLQVLLSLTASYNLLVILTFVISGLSTYFLVRYLTRKELPSLMAGALFAFSPYRIAQLSHINLLATSLIPLYVLMILKARDALTEGKRAGWLYFSLAGLLLGLVAYDTEHYAIMLVVFNVVFLAAVFPFHGSGGSRRAWLRLLAGIGATTLIALVSFSPMLAAARSELERSGDFVTVEQLQIENLSAGVQSFFIPDRDLDWGLTSLSFLKVKGKGKESTYLGFGIVLLAAIGAWSARKARYAGLWIVTALVFAVLSLGPFLIIRSKITGIPMPYWLINQIPLFNMIRAPARYVVITSLALAVLAGYGANAVIERSKGIRYSKLMGPLMIAFIPAVLFIDIDPRPNLVSMEVPQVYHDIAASGVPGSVLSLPLGWSTASTGNPVGRETAIVLLDQTAHERPILGGMVARVPSGPIYAMASEPVIDFLSDPAAPPGSADLDPANIARVMEKYQVAFIVVDKINPSQIFGGKESVFPTGFSDAELAAVDRYVTGSLGMQKFEETDEIVAYQRPG